MNRLSLFALPMLAAVAHAQTVTFVPQTEAANDSIGYQTQPFNTDLTWSAGPTPTRIMWVMDSAVFTDAGVPSAPILISRIRLRTDNEAGFPDSFAGGTDPNFTLDLSTAAVDYTAASATFNANHGPDRARVFSGPLTIPAGSTPGNGGAGGFDVSLTLNAPFLWNPASGDLVLDMGCSGTQPVDWMTWADETAAGLSLENRGTNIEENTSQTAASGVVWAGEVPCLDIQWAPAAGLVPSFSQDVFSGNSPLTVNFTDTSFTSDPLGVSLAEFDFTNDGTFDANTTGGGTVSNSYGCGLFDVAIRATDSVNGQATNVVTGAVTVDPLSLSITANRTLITVGDSVNFGAAAPAGTTFAWDLDGDGLVDDTTSAPSFTYNTAGTYLVDCTAALACNVVSEQLTIDVRAGVLVTAPPSATYPYGPGAVSYVDVTVTAPNGVIIEELYHRSDLGNDPVSLELYLLNAPLTTTIGNEDPANFTLISTGSATSPPTSAAQFEVDIADVVLAPGTYGIAVVNRTGGQLVDTAGSGIVTSNAAISMTPNGAAFALAPNEFIYTNEGWCGGFAYREVQDLIPLFTADVTGGASPLTVNFTDQSLTNDVNGILGYGWDFENDGTDDAFTANATHVYPACGDYSVRLTVIDSLNGQRQLVKTDYIMVDTFPASFSKDRNIGDTGSAVNFTYTGDPAALVTWDFDSNGTTDAVGPNGAFTYGAPGAYTITMTATLGCRSDNVTDTITIADRVIEPAASPSGLYSTFYTPPDASYMDLDVGNISGITVTDIAFRSKNIGFAHDIEVYVQLNTPAAGNIPAANWGAPISTGTATPTGVDELFVIDVVDFTLPVGSHAMAIVTRSANSSHTWNVGNLNSTTTNGSISLTIRGSDSNFDAASNAAATNPNGFSGAILYSLGGAAPAPGTVGQFAPGCAGTFGLSDIQPGVQPPAIGTTWAARVSNVGAAVQVHGGISNTFNATYGVPLPVDLQPLLNTAAGCRFFVSSEVILLAFPDAFNDASFAVTIPNNPAFSGLTVYLQGLVFDAGVPGGIVTSNAYFGVIQ